MESSMEVPQKQKAKNRLSLKLIDSTIGHISEEIKTSI
jgi:hypothetical protein